MANEIAAAAMTARMKLPDIEERDKPKRRPIPDHIPRMEVELTPGADACADCGGRLRRIAGSPRGGDRAAFMYSLIVTAKMNDVDPQAWLAEVLRRLPDTPLSCLPELLPWNWKAHHIAQAA